MSPHKIIHAYRGQLINAHINFVYTSNQTENKLNVYQQINKLWYVHTMEYYSDFKRKELLIH